MSDAPPHSLNADALPAHAATIYTRGPSLCLALPTRTGRTQTITLPSTPAGFERLLTILREREREISRTNSIPAFSTPSIPTQSLVDAIKITTTVRTTIKPVRGNAPAHKFAAITETELSILSDALSDIFEEF